MGYDPLAVLEQGEYGADIAIAHSAVGDDYDNEDLSLVICYRDGNLLREATTDTFVRQLRDADGDPLGSLPPDADPNDERFSPLLLTDVPPQFVTLNGPDDRNVVTRIMGLDVTLDKLALVTKFAAAIDGPEGDTDYVESLLDQLADVDEPETVEQLLRKRLF